MRPLPADGPLAALSAAAVGAAAVWVEAVAVVAGLAVASMSSSKLQKRPCAQATIPVLRYNTAHRREDGRALYYRGQLDRYGALRPLPKWTWGGQMTFGVFSGE